MDSATNLKKLEEKIKNCRECDLWKSRNNAVPGSGSYNAKIFFIGEAPGRNEDIQGEPFVGRAGKILDDLLKETAIKRDDIFISNILKCRPPKNRNPMKSEIEKCTNLYLSKQLELIDPEIIVTLGSFASEYILERYNKEFDKISKQHGKIINIDRIDGKITIIPMFHPAVATYNPNKKDDLLKDFKVLKQVLID
jgi:uracil-DNA glycosylase